MAGAASPQSALAEGVSSPPANRQGRCSGRGGPPTIFFWAQKKRLLLHHPRFACRYLFLQWRRRNQAATPPRQDARRSASSVRSTGRSSSTVTARGSSPLHARK